MCKNFSKTVLIYTLILLLLFATVTAIVDPFYHYHAPIMGLQPVGENERYQNFGMASHLEYDSMVTGSSMTENFRASWFDKAFGIKTVKLPFSGGHTENYTYLFDAMFQTRQVKKVFMSLDTVSLMTDNAENPLPLYLLDDDKLNDVSYLLNKEALIRYGSRYLLENVRGMTDVDNMYAWQENAVFGKEAVLKKYTFYPPAQPLAEDTFLAICEKNLGDILPYIEAHPETEFYFFLPPYSVLYWDKKNAAGETDAVFCMLEYAAGKLLAYENVRLFDYQNIEEIITDLDLYKDYAHYSADINKRIVDSMASGTYALTKENYKAEIAKTKNFMENYDFAPLRAEKARIESRK